MNQQKNIITKVLSIFLPILIGTIQSISAQNLCDNLPAGAVKGAFEIEGNITTGCSPLTVKVHDKSGGTDIRYLFQYKDEKANALDMVNHKDSTDVLFSNPSSIRVYTILQYGTKGGKPMYACQNVSVRPNNKPVFSFNSCNNNNIEISIPLDPANDFDFYKISWGDGNPDETITKIQIPFTKSKNLILPKTISVQGFFTNASLNCSVSPPVTVPYKNPLNFPNGYEDEHKVNIDLLELTSATKAELTFHGSFDKMGYSLYIKEQNSKIIDEIKKNVLPGKLQITLPDSTKSYCYFFSRINSCGLDQSAEICTLPIFGVDVSEKTNTINWSTYPNEITSSDSRVYGRFLDKKIEVISETNNIKNPISVSNSSQFYIDTPNDCKNRICYRIELETSGQLFYYKYSGKTISNKICIDREQYKPPKLSDITLDVVNNNININFIDNSNWNLSKEKYYLFEEVITGFLKIDSVLSVNDFSISNFDPSRESKCFKISYKDECGSTSELSPKVCNVLLESENSGNLNWNNSNPFGNTLISDYQILGITEKTNILYEASQKITSKLNFTVDLGNFETEAKFKVVIYGINGKVSNSNYVLIPIEPVFFLPDAITPNRDNINDVLEVKGRFGRVKSYTLKIFDRWGTEIFNTKDKTQKWDGTLDGKLLPIGIYQYSLDIILNDGQKIIKTGKFEILQ